jgi:hypothetical protein
MHPVTHRLVGLALSTVVLAASWVRAEAPPDPLHLVPPQADLLVKIDNPRHLVETIANLDVLNQLKKMQAVQEQLDSTNSRRFLQLVAYFEKELGLKWPEMLDRLAGGGGVFALKFRPQPPPLEVVIQGRDPDLLHRFVQIASVIVEQELARQESKDRLEKGIYRDLETFQIGKDFHAAAAGSALVIANSKRGLHMALDLHLDDNKKSLAGVAGVAEARKLLPPDPLVWAWLDFTPLHNAPQAKDVFAQPRNDANLTVLFGGWLDVARRSPFGCAAVYRESDQLVTTFRMPQGREGMPPELAVHIPPSDQAGSLPLLEPKGVVYSTSYYLDLSKFWECRTKLFNDQQVKAFEESDKKSAPFLLGNRLSKLLTQAGAYERFVATYQPRESAATGPLAFYSQLAFGLVVDMRDPAFGKSLGTILRGAALLARTQVKLKQVQEQYGDVTIIGYRFEQDESVPKAVVQSGPSAYFPTPSFAVVGKQFVVTSTVELCRELVDLLQEESKSASAGRKHSAAVRTRLYGPGGADWLDANQGLVFTQTVLGQALTAEEAKAQVQLFVDWMRHFGPFEIEARYGDHDFRYDLIYSPQRHKQHKENTKQDR